MIRKENRYDANAYRYASMDLDPSVERIEEGSFVTIKNGKLVQANKESKKAFIAMGSKREGRDQVTGKIFQKISFLIGPFVLSIDNFDLEGNYDEDMTPLTLNEQGIVTPAENDEDTIVAYAMGAPKNNILRIVNA